MIAVLAAATLLLQGRGGEPGPTPDVAAPLAEVAPTVDGVLDDGAWSLAAPIVSFLLSEPRDGALPTRSTRVRLLFSEEALYVGAELEGEVSTRTGRRDMGLEGSDWLRVFVDVAHEHRAAYEFAVNPSGVRRDRILTEDGAEEPGWDPAWEAATSRSPRGWTAELRIPLRSVRFRGHGRALLWGLLVERSHAATGERSRFPHQPRERAGGIPAYAHMGGPIVPSRGVAVDLRPDLRITRDRRLGGAGGLRVDGGLDVGAEVGTASRIDGTVNPDFGQVEADPAVLNLSAFELQLAERRPFFVESRDLFRLAPGVNPNPAFHSRRIGAPPAGRTGGLSVGGEPMETRIRGAGRLVAGGGRWSAAVLGAATAPASTLVLVDEDPSPKEVIVGTADHFAAARLQGVWREGRTSLGLMATHVRRGRDPVVDLHRRSRATAIGGEIHAESPDRAWAFTGFVAGSRVEGSPPAILATQRSSARYFQRPDAAHLGVDSTATRMSGTSLGGRLARRAGRHWRGSVGGIYVSPGFEVNDLGFQRRADQIAGSLELRYLDQPTRGGIRGLAVALYANQAFNTAGTWLGSGLELEVGLSLANLWETEVEVSWEGGGVDDRVTRGGPAVPRHGVWSAEFELATDARRPLRAAGELQVAYGRSERSMNVFAEVGVRASPTVDIRLVPEWEAERDDRRFVAVIGGAPGAGAGEPAWAFVRGDSRAMSLGLRVGVALAPDLDLEAWVRPFVATVRAGPGGDAYGAAASGWDDPSLTRASVTGTAVARWEWRPGSTLWLAWQLRGEDARGGASGLGTGLSRLRDLAPEGALTLKGSVWVG